MDGMFLVDAWEFRVKDSNQAASLLLEYSRKELFQKYFPELFSQSDHQQILDLLQAGRQEGGGVSGGTFIKKESVEEVHADVLCCDGKSIPVDIQKFDLRVNSETYFFLVLHDNRECWKSWRAQKIALSVFAAAGEGIVVTDFEGTILMVNQAFTRITGYKEEEVIGQNPRILKSGRHDAAFYEELWNSLIKRGIWQGQIWNKNKDGKIYPEWVTIRSAGDEKGNPAYYTAVFFDRTEYQEMEEQLRYLTDYDVLTGLPNRKLFLERLALAIGHVKRRQQKLAIFVINLRQFHAINEVLGHQEGDCLLKEVAQRIKMMLPPDDLVVRLDGADFAVLLFETAGDEEIAKVAERLLNEIEKPWSFNFNKEEFQVGAQMGIAVFPQDGQDEETLLRNATVAMERKTSGSSLLYQFYAPEINEKIGWKFTLEQQLRLAVQRQEFVLYFQPKVDVQNRKISGVEALVRWQHQERGLISPLDFIPLAEETGLILPIGEWVLRTACLQNKAWQEAGYPPFRIAVNLSAKQFRQPELAERVAEILSECGMEGKWLELEITESVVMQDVHHTLQILEELHSMGIGLSLDDFGTGYSSLSYLKRFPIQTMKIDQSFVREIPENPEDVAIVSTIIALAKHLKLRIIAEGVETSEQLSFLQEQDCEEAQGYFFSRPLPAEEILEFIKEGTF